MTGHPATLYGFVIGLVALVGMIVLVALHDASVDIALPIISAIALGGVGAAAGVAQQNTTATTGTVTTVNPNE